MMNSDQYRTSLDDGRTVYFDGQPVDDVREHPVIGPCATLVAQSYDRIGELYPDGSPFTMAPRSLDDLREANEAIRPLGIMTLLTYASMMAMTTAASRIEEASAASDFPDRIRGMLEDFRERDVRFAQCITDAKGDRSLAPGKQSDPDAYTRVVKRSEEGVWIRGAKLHITGASLAHELMVIPTKAMKPGEEDYAIACCVPVNAPGVTIVDTSTAPTPSERPQSPFSSTDSFPEAMVIFDDVFVPNERLMLDGEIGMAAIFAHSLGLWERVAGLTHMVDDAELLVGLAHLIAEANGLLKVSHINQKISDLIMHATMLRASLDAALSNGSQGEDGTMFPNELYTNAGKYFGASNWHPMVQKVQEIAGGSVITAPTLADLNNPEIGATVKRYMTGATADGEYRARLFHAIRDLTAGNFGGWKAVTKVQGGGGLYAQRIVTRKHFDLNAAREAALHATGLEIPSAD